MSKSLLLKFPTLTCAFLGALSALSLAPIHWFWVLFVTVPGLIFILANQHQLSSWRFFILGQAFGFGYFLAALHWIGFAFAVNGTQDLWMMPFALAGLAAFLALFWAFASALAGLAHRQGFALWIALPITMSIFEWLRGHVLTGFPWAVFGQATLGLDNLTQLASLIGMNGLTFMVWLWAAALFGLTRQKLIACGILATLPLSVAWGMLRLSQNATTFVPDVSVRLVQPNVDQNDKWRASNARGIFDKLLQLTAQASTTGIMPTHIIWPESSIPFLIDESSEGKDTLKAHLQPGQTLIVGAVRRKSQVDRAIYFTSILLFNDQAEVLSHYDKWHLVPGGEFLPLAWLLEPLGLRKLVVLPESFNAGFGPATLPIPGAGLAGLSICYEAIFPFAVSDPQTRASWLINVTNDGWFGNSAGPHQHLAQMQLRSIELGLPAARAANSGISAMIDPLGRLTFKSKLLEQGAFDVALPQPLSPTLYSRIGDLALLSLVFFALALAWVTRNRQNSNKM